MVSPRARRSISMGKDFDSVRKNGNLRSVQRQPFVVDKGIENGFVKGFVVEERDILPLRYSPMVTHSDEKHNQYRDLSYIRQYFGNEPKLWVDENDHRIHAKIKTSRLCFKYWYISYAWEFTIISPEDIKIEIREHAEEILQKCGAK